VGQGIAGSAIGMQLLELNKKCFFIDEKIWNSPSRISNGIVNPVTGQKYVKTWLFDELFHVAKPFYNRLEQLFGVKLYHETSITKLFTTALEANEFDSRVVDSKYAGFLESAIPNVDDKTKGAFKGKIKNVFWIDTALLIDETRKYLIENKILDEEKFDHLGVKKTRNNQFTYRENTFNKIIFCEGAKGLNNPYFPNLQFVFAKGELITVQFNHNFGNEIIQKNGILSPHKNGIFKFGSTNTWTDLLPNPTEAGKQELANKLEQITDLPFEICNHFAAIRPTTKDRRPFLGESELEKNIFILNGLGTKGVSLAPYFSNMLIAFMEKGTPILPNVLWNRFSKK
jgi:hypothetical protein